MSPSAAPLLPDHLAAGYARFRTGRYAADRERYLALAERPQQPPTMVIACSDSRSAPEAVFDAGAGQLFVIRNVAGLVPVYAPDDRSHAASAALEYAVLALGVTSIVVLGHGRCGGIAAATADHAALSATDFVGTWVAPIRDIAADVAPTDPLATRLGHRTAVELRSVEQSLANLNTFPWIRSRAGDGRLRLVGAWYDIGLGELHALGPDGWARIETDGEPG
jgi:carbonic anhydrase